jgi:pimeloyl-ACP methyl ester carboxylesterase
MSVAASPFEIHVEDAVLDDLRRRIEGTRWPDEIPGMDWELGVELSYARELADYWAHGFDWRAREAKLNRELPGFKCTLEGLNIHYARVDGGGDSKRPALMLIHGWPSSFAEMAKLAPLLADGFDVVVPSLPGHGFSSIPRTAGFGVDECAEVLIRLMKEVLGHERFIVHGGDRGAFIATSMAYMDPKAIAGIHLPLPLGILGEGDEATAEEAAFAANTAKWLVEEGGYSAIQSTRPQTLAYAMHDSPVGTMAWIIEKFRVWSDCNGDIESRFTRDELLTNVTIYWVTQTLRSSAHWYWERRTRPPVGTGPVRIDVPTGVAMFPKEVMRTPRSAVARKYDLRHWTTMNSGGHFPACEEPEALAADIRAFAGLVDL